MFYNVLKLSSFKKLFFQVMVIVKLMVLPSFNFVHEKGSETLHKALTNMRKNQFRKGFRRAL